MRAALLILLGLICVAGSAFAETARVTYVTSKSFYADAGEQAGLVPGTMVDVVRGGEVIGQARIREVSTTRCVLEWVQGDSLAQVGDEIHFTVAVRADGGAVAAKGRSSVWDRMGLHGRIGLQTLHLRDRSDYGADFDQPALTLRLEGRRLGGTGLGVEADVRGRVVRRSADGQSETSSRSRVYRLNVSGDLENRGLTWVAGRQFAPSLSVIHLFDGARVQVDRRGWSAGVLGGAQPDPQNLGLSGDVIEGGAWFTLRRNAERTRWAATAALIGAYDKGNIDREFTWLQGRWARDAFSLRIDQVLDLNRSWKSDAGEPTISSTSTYLAGRWQVNRRVGIDAGLDTRRRVRFYRDRETPETEFDDNYRQGYWAGVRARPVRWLDVGVQGRTRLRTDAERADSGTLNLGFDVPRWSPLRVYSRTTAYRSEMVKGWLQSVRVSTPLHPRVDGSVFAGVRYETGRNSDAMGGTDPWFGVNLDFTLARRAWLSLSFESSWSGEEAYDQFWLGTGLRF
jgi:hypothetical protein